jgi:hypothetical protein
MSIYDIATDNQGAKKLKVKTLGANSRNFIAMAIRPDVKKTRIYLHGVSKTTGAGQWYQSNFEFTQKTALNYFYEGQYSVVFANGMTKSNVTDWVK